MIELGHQNFLVLLRALALGDVDREPIEAHKAPGGVELSFRCFLEPYLTAIETQKAIGDRTRRIVSIQGAPHCLHARKIVWMDPRKEGLAVKGLLRIISQKLRGIVAAPHRIG